MNADHYFKFKSICVWLNILNRQASYKDAYLNWATMTSDEQIIKLDYIESVLAEYLVNEEDEDFVCSFKSAIESIQKIKDEIKGGYKTTFTCEEDAREYGLAGMYRRNNGNWEFEILKKRETKLGAIYFGEDGYTYPEKFIEKVKK